MHFTLQERLLAVGEDLAALQNISDREVFACYHSVELAHPGSQGLACESSNALHTSEGKL